jgi:hypothetical protein
MNVNSRQNRKNTNLRSRSNSPANSSIESCDRFNTRRSSRSTSRSKCKQDVQVFTSLPPKVEGDIKFYLILQINKINWLATGIELTDNDTKQAKKTNAKQQHRKLDQLKLIARCLWWGEENSNGAVFRPKLNDEKCSSSSIVQSTAKYMVRSGYKQFSAYLNDMKTLDIELINESTRRCEATVQINNISELSTQRAIKGYFPAFNHAQVKVADVSVSIKLEQPSTAANENKTNSFNQSMSNVQANASTPASQANIDEFDKKLHMFENRQLKENNFNSDIYKNWQSESTSNNFTDPIINTLIEQANRLKNDMMLSSATVTGFVQSTHGAFDIDYENYESECVNLFPFLRSNKTSHADYLNENTMLEIENANDISRLTDPIHDPELLNALLYDNHKEPTHRISGNTFDVMQDSDYQDDAELNQLLNPTNDLILSSKITGSAPKPVEAEIRLEKPRSLRQRSLSRSSNSSNGSDNEDFGDKRSNLNRVSFELQSSDGESVTGNDLCMDVLSAQRLSLLNLVQIAKFRLDKMCFYNLNHILERVNELNATKLNQLRDGNCAQKSTKPPKALKKLDLSESFFVEYQFPVIASSRDNLNDVMATQCMRANSKQVKRQSEDAIVFDHGTDYSVLFNSSSLESWWRSAIAFKIYYRSSHQCAPILIGLARLKLKNVLKARNFKLYKKLAINDQLNTGNESRRIGTLHVKIELSSDLKEFNVDLMKLRNYEQRKSQATSASVRQSPVKQQLNKPECTQAVVGFSPSKLFSSQKHAIQANIHRPIALNANQVNLANLNLNNSIEEFSMPIQMFLSINEGRGFNLSLFNSTIYLICRLFWSKEKVKFENTQEQAQSQFCWTLNLSFMIKPSLIENMKNNFMIIEAWSKSKASNESDALLGTIKLPLHEFYLKFNNFAALKQLLSDDQNEPLIGVNGWISVSDPFTGKKAGEINLLLAMGSHGQILNLQKILFDKARIRIQNEQQMQSAKMIEHIFTFQVDNLRVRCNQMLDENDFYVKYTFPTTILNEQDDGRVKFNFNTHSLSSKLNKCFYNKLEHRIVLEKESSLTTKLREQFDSYYKTDKTSVLFEIWCHSRQQAIARGELSLDSLISLVNNTTIDLNNRTFSIPLVDVVVLPRVDKFVGQLTMTIEYRSEAVMYNLNVLKKSQIECSAKREYVNMNVAILRANGLQMAISSSICKDDKRSFNILNSNVYVKFALNFLNRPQEVHKTRCTTTSLNGFSPEFFDYFDIPCPLTSTYDSNKKKTISLAEQLEVGQILFEVWVKFNDSIDMSNDVLLGTCTVPLESLLENRIGVRGWIPIKALGCSSSEQSIGAIEIAIRFMKTDDYLKILDSAKQIGWVRATEFQNTTNSLTTSPPRTQIINEKLLSAKTNPSTQHFLNELMIESNFPSSSPTVSDRKSVKCLFEIEKAVHLPNIFEENRHTAPNAFVTFSTNAHNPSEIAQTNIVEKHHAPVWNFQIQLSIDYEYFLEENRYFTLKVWHRAESSRTSNKILGYVMIDLTPLIYGLTHISGWYNIHDSVNNTQGQLKINLVPQESLSDLKKTLNSMKRSNEKPMSPSSFNLMNEIKLKSEMLSICLNSKEANSSSSRSSSCDSRDLKSGLFQKLNELDELNKKLKKRLEKKLESVCAQPQEQKQEKMNNHKQDLEEKSKKSSRSDSNNSITKQDHEPCEQKSHSPDFIEIDKENLMGERTPSSKPAETQTSTNMADHNEDDDEFLKSLKHHEQVQQQVINEHNLHNHAQNPSLFDSFWVQSVNALDNLDSVKQSENEQKQVNLEPALIKQNHSQQNVQQNDPNDTDLDQTFNLNASYEIVNFNNNNASNNRINSETASIANNNDNNSFAIDSYDIVDKIIDCNKLEAETDVNPNEVDANGANYCSLYSQNPNDLCEDFMNNDDENLTVIVPEQINRVNEEPFVSAQSDIQEKEDEQTEFDKEKELNAKVAATKIPNYFLPTVDLEKNMRRLHFNYVAVSFLNYFFLIYSATNSISNR